MWRERVVGWDLGGAHLKAASLQGGRLEQVVQWPCPLWLGLDRLEQAVTETLERLQPAPRHALTMTGEMADLFADRASGVSAILGVMERRLPAGAARVFAGPVGLLTPEQAVRVPDAVASANWQASATFVAREEGDALLVDIGSTTADLVPVREGRIAAVSHGDGERLESEELIYSGVVRTPLMVLARRAPFAGEWVGVMAEQFATTADVHRLTGRLPAHADQGTTADGAGRSETESARRLARLVGRDVEDAPMCDWRALAAWFAERQLRQLFDGCARVLSRAPLPRNAPIVGAGVGRFLAAELARRLARPYRDFNDYWSPSTGPWSAADCAPAAALARLAEKSP